jgi:hypothetical protein
MTALIEQAPGATRALVVDGDTVIEAHLRRSDVALPFGLVAPARLLRREGAQAVVQIAGDEALLSPRPSDWHEGQTRLAQVVREARSDGARDKQARVMVHAGPAQGAPALAESFPGHVPVSPFGVDQLAQAGWDAVVEEAVDAVELNSLEPAITVKMDEELAVVEVVLAGETQAMHRRHPTVVDPAIPTREVEVVITVPGNGLFQRVE